MNSEQGKKNTKHKKPFFLDHLMSHWEIHFASICRHFPVCFALCEDVRRAAVLSVMTPLTLLSVHPRTHRSDWEGLSSADSLLSPCSLWNTRPHTLLFISFQRYFTICVCNNQLQKKTDLGSNGAEFSQQRWFLGVVHIVLRLLPFSQGTAVCSWKLTLLIG